MPQPIDPTNDLTQNLQPENGPSVPLTNPDSTLRPRDSIVPDAATDAAGEARPNPTGYELLGELGRGGMGVVYKARHIDLNRTVALKMILAGGHAGSAEIRRFLSEAEAVAAIAHPNIVQIYEVGHHQGLPFIALEFVEGGTLADRLKQGPLAPKEAARLIEQLARGLNAAHQAGIVHRDLKPANILLAEDGAGKVTDFGLAKKVEGGSGLTQTGAILGTPAYMAPEQAAGEGRRVGPAADVYALGAILYECLTGRPPFHAATPLDTLVQVIGKEPAPPRQVNPRVPRDLETICLKCLNKEVGKRYASAYSLAEDLRRWQADEPIKARPVGRVERTVRWCRRKPLGAAAVVLVALLLVGAVVVPLLIAARESANAQALAEEKSRTQEALEESKENERKVKQAAEQVAAAEREKTEKLWQSYLDQARLGRLSKQIGQRFASLDALASAARIRPDLRLRNEAIACMALADIRPAPGVTFPQDARFWGYQGQNTSAVDPTTGQQAVFREKVIHILARDGTPIRTIGPVHTCQGLLFSPDGQMLAAAAPENKAAVVVYRVRDGRVQSELPHISGIYRMEFDPLGSLLLTHGYDAITRLWDPVSGRLLVRTTDWVVHGPFSPDNRLLQNGAQAWELAAGAECRVLNHSFLEGRSQIHGPWDVSFSSDSRHLATAGGDGVRLWEVRTGRELAILPNSTSASAAFHPDGSLFLGSGGLWEEPDGSLWQWPVRSAANSVQLGPPQEVRPVKFCLPRTPNRRQIRCSSVGQVAVLEAGKNQVLLFPPGKLDQPLRLPAPPNVSYLALREDGQFVAGCPHIVGQGTTIRNSRFACPPGSSISRFACRRRRTSPTWRRPGQGRIRCCFSPPGSSISRFACRRASGSAPCKVLSPAHPEPEADPVQFSGPSGGAGSREESGAAFPPREARSAASPAGAADNAGRTVRDLAVSSMARVMFTPNGEWLVAGTLEAYRFFRVGTWEPGLSIPRKSNLPGPLAFSPDGRLMAVVPTNLVVQLVNPRTGEELATLTPPEPRIVSELAFSPDGSKLAVCTESGYVFVWDLAALWVKLSEMGLARDLPAVLLPKNSDPVAIPRVTFKDGAVPRPIVVNLPLTPAWKKGTPEEVRDWLAQLDTPKAQAAAQSLAALGPAVLPALDKAEADASPAVRQTLQTIRSRIDRDEAVQPRRVTLRLDKASVRDAVAAMAKESGLPLTLDGDPDGVVSLRFEDAPVWQAFDELTRQAKLAASLTAGRVVLRPGEGTPAEFVAYPGPFRLQAGSWYQARTVKLSDAFPGPARSQLSLQLSLAEPGRSRVVAIGTPQAQSAVTDQGESLAALTVPGTGMDPALTTVGLRSTGLSLQAPTKPARKVTVEAVLPVEIATNQQQQLDVALSDMAPGKWFPLAGGGWMQPQGVQARAGASYVGFQLTSAASFLSDPRKLQLELTDEAGRTYRGSVYAGSPQPVRGVLPGDLMLTSGAGDVPWAELAWLASVRGATRTVAVNAGFPTLEAPGPKSRLRLITLDRERVDLSFTFRDLPLP